MVQFRVLSRPRVPFFVVLVVVVVVVEVDWVDFGRDCILAEDCTIVAVVVPVPDPDPVEVVVVGCMEDDTHNLDCILQVLLEHWIPPN